MTYLDQTEYIEQNSEFDLLDWDKERLVWIMTYRDGRVRRSQYRHDLIHDINTTKLTDAARKRW